MEKFKAYTLAEVLIAMTIVGIVAAVSIPNITKLIPNKNAALIKKAYYVVDNIVQELINDKYYYPDATGNCFGYIAGDENNLTEAMLEPQMIKDSGIDGCYYGFDNRCPVKIQGTNRVVSGDEKFVALFISKLNTKKDVEEILYDESGNFKLTSSDIDVETEDGMLFHFMMQNNAENADKKNGKLQGDYKDKFRWESDWETSGVDPELGPVSNSGQVIQNTLTLDVNGNKQPNTYPKRDNASASSNNRCRNVNGTQPWVGGICTVANNSYGFRNVREDNFDTIQLVITRDGRVLVPENYSLLAKILDNRYGLAK